MSKKLKDDMSEATRMLQDQLDLIERLVSVMERQEKRLRAHESAIASLMPAAAQPPAPPAVKSRGEEVEEVAEQAVLEGRAAHSVVVTEPRPWSIWLKDSESAHLVSECLRISIAHLIDAERAAAAGDARRKALEEAAKYIELVHIDHLTRGSLAKTIRCLPPLDAAAAPAGEGKP